MSSRSERYGSVLRWVFSPVLRLGSGVWPCAACILIVVMGGCRQDSHAASRAGRENSAPFPPEVLESAAQVIAAFAAEVPTVPDEGPNQLLHRFFALGRDYPVQELGGDQTTCLAFLLGRASSATIYGVPVIDRRPGGWMFFRPYGKQMRTVHEAHPTQFAFLLTADGDLDWQATKATPPTSDPPISLQELLATEMKTFHAGVDGSWLLATLAVIDPSASWENRFNEAWSFESLTHHQLDWDASNLPCWGQHRLYGLAVAADRGRQALVDGTAVTLDGLLVHEVAQAWGGYDRDAGGFAVPAGAVSGEGHASSHLDSSEINTGAMSRDLLQFSYNAHVLEWMLACPADLRSIGGAQLHEAVYDLSQAAMARREAPTIIKAHAVHALRVYTELGAIQADNSN